MIGKVGMECHHAINGERRLRKKSSVSASRREGVHIKAMQVQDDVRGSDESARGSRVVDMVAGNQDGPSSPHALGWKTQVAAMRER